MQGLKWFESGDEIILELRHVLDFLNQIGALVGELQYDHLSNSHLLGIFHDRQSLLNWNPEPKPISVRTSEQPDGPYIQLNIVFDNGLYCNVPVGFDPVDGGNLEDRRKLLLEAKTNDMGNIEFSDGSILEHQSVYITAVETRCDPTLREQNRGPVVGPWIRMVPKKSNVPDENK